jgi:hypothetical protein
MPDAFSDYFLASGLASALFDFGSGTAMMILVAQAYASLRPTSSHRQERQWAWLSLLAYGLTAGSAILLTGVAEMLLQNNVRAPWGLVWSSALLKAASPVAVLLYALWLPPLSIKQPFQASERLRNWSMAILLGGATWLLAPALQPTLLVHMDGSPGILARINPALTALAFAAATAIVWRKLRRATDADAQAGLSWALIPLAAYPGFLLAGLLFWLRHTQTPFLSPEHLLNFAGVDAIVLLVPLLVVLAARQLRGWSGFQTWREAALLALLLAVGAVVYMSQDHRAAVIFAWAFRIFTILGPVYALAGNAPRSSHVPNVGWTAIAAAAVVAMPGLALSHGIVAKLLWGFTLAVIVGAAPVLFLQSLRRWMNWFGAGRGWNPQGG